MPPETLTRPTLAELVDRARALVPPAGLTVGPPAGHAAGPAGGPRPRRRILGIAGPPGAGKSTLAEAIVAALGADAVLVPMDGFHLENEELVRLGLRERKGAPPTFDATGYAALLARLRVAPDRVTRAPLFRRDLDRSIAFYTEVLGMQLLRRKDYPEGKFTLAFVGYGSEESGAAIELTYNYGVDKYELGTAFGHIALAVPDAAAACAAIRARGGKVVREAGPMRHSSTVIAFVEDPDGYKIELIQR